MPQTDLDYNWIKGHRVAICDSDARQAERLAEKLKAFGLEVFRFETPAQLTQEIERRHYTTHRFYLAAFIDFSLAKAVRSHWDTVTTDNPTILETPIVLLYYPPDLGEAQPFIDQGYFRFQLAKPVEDLPLNSLLEVLNRWKKQQYELCDSVNPAAVFGRDD